MLNWGDRASLCLPSF